MKVRDLFANWGLARLKLSLGFATLDWEPQDDDRKAAWDLYVELLTRVTTQPLEDAHGDERSGLDSVHSLFATTRQVLRDNGPGCVLFSRVAVVVLNQVVRPFTSRWHKAAIDGAFSNSDRCAEFRTDLRNLQGELAKYATALADIADVEDLSALSDHHSEGDPS